MDRALAAFDGERIVGTTGAYSFAMTVPGGAAVPTAGVTMVTVATSHRRRGILTEMMRRQLDEITERGEPLAALNASESHIYGRFGYGPAVDAVRVEVDSRAAGFRDPLGDHGSCEVVDRDVAAGMLPGVYDRFRVTQPGSLTRSEGWWRILLGWDECWKGGGDFFVVLHRSPSGEPDGYALYRMRWGLDHGNQVGTVEVLDLVGVDDRAEAALWRYCLDVDLTVRLVAPIRPADEPLRWRLAEPRQLRTAERVDLLWVRLVDVAGALAARRYGPSPPLVLEMRDAWVPANEGCWLLDPDRATCTRTERSPDLSLDVGDLAVTYLGSTSFSVLAAAGRVVELRSGAVDDADRAFATPRAPHCTTRF